MIFVTLGTQDKSFERLLSAIDKAIADGFIKEEVIVQAGYTKYESSNMKIFDYLSSEQMQEYINKCNYIIAHGGVGSIFDGLKCNKKIIVAPRLKEFGEHTNDHQLQIVENFGKLGYILPLTNFEDLSKIIKKIEKFKPKKFNSNVEKFNNVLNNKINDYLN